MVWSRHYVVEEFVELGVYVVELFDDGVIWFECGTTMGEFA
jgi:hypothetical protein